jgi:heme/copper-type cytochrome/quinol oxidase subunit 2
LNVWDGFGGHVGSARIWLTLPVLIGLASAGVAVYSLAMIAPGPAQETSTTNYFWAGIALIVITGYLATVATTSLFVYAARRQDSPER